MSAVIEIARHFLYTTTTSKKGIEDILLLYFPKEGMQDVGRFTLRAVLNKGEDMIRKPIRARDTAAAISGVDQRLRDCLQVLWLALPSDKQNIEELEKHYKRLVDRALRDFKEDLELFPPED